MKHQRPTIHDVAREAGVATSTVSRAFTRPERVNVMTRERVVAAANRLGYRPNPLARALPSGRTRTVAMLVSDITNPHYFEMIRGAEQRAKAAGLTMVLVNTEESAHTERNQIEQLARSVDGFILASSRMADRDIRALARDHNLALISRELKGLPSVVVDQLDGSRQMVDHLWSLGHRSLIYLAGPRVSWLGVQRWRAISAAAKHLDIAAQRVGPFTPTVASGGAAADAALGSRATAVIAHNDLLAIGILRRLGARGIQIPDEMSVLGFDDIFAADMCTPTLTTLGGPHADAGRRAVELLLESSSTSLSNRGPQQVVLPSQLVIRESTGAARRVTGAGRR